MLSHVTSEAFLGFVLAWLPVTLPSLFLELSRPFQSLFLLEGDSCMQVGEGCLGLVTAPPLFLD